MPEITDQMRRDTDAAVTNWICGSDLGLFDDITEDAETGAKLLSEFDDLTVDLLTQWRGYLDANRETGVQPTVEDFVLATYVINKMEATNG